MAKQYVLILLLLMPFGSATFAQNTYSISGTVKDAQGYLPGAAVYLSGYKIATVTNNEGKFNLPNLQAGSYDILMQVMGYLPFTQNILITNKGVNIAVTLKENVVQLNEVVIKPDPNRLRHIALFKSLFIGKTPNAEQCKILNTDVLIINDDRETRVLTITSNELLIIENKALGYKLKYLLAYFEYNYATNIIYYAGNPYFEELAGSRAKQKKWLKNREVAYLGSAQHFIKSLYQNKVTEEGFIINKLIKINNPNRKPDSLINANIKRLTAGQDGLTRLLTFNGTDSLSYWLKQKKEPKLMSTINRNIVLIDTLVTKFDDDVKAMNYSDALYVIYKNERENDAYMNSGLWQSRPLDVPNYQISVVNLMAGAVKFYPNGSVLDPRSLLYQGFWAYEKIADMVPLDYIYTAKK